MTREEELTQLLPSSYYADRDLAFRIQRMVESWKRAVRSNTSLSIELDAVVNGDVQPSKVEEKPAGVAASKRLTVCTGTYNGAYCTVHGSSRPHINVGPRIVDGAIL